MVSAESLEQSSCSRDRVVEAEVGKSRGASEETRGWSERTTEQSGRMNPTIKTSTTRGVPEMQLGSGQEQDRSLNGERSVFRVGPDDMLPAPYSSRTRAPLATIGRRATSRAAKSCFLTKVLVRRDADARLDSWPKHIFASCQHGRTISLSIAKSQHQRSVDSRGGADKRAETWTHVIAEVDDGSNGINLGKTNARWQLPRLAHR